MGAGRDRRRPRARWALLLAATGAVYLGALALVGLEDAWSALRRASPGALTAALALQAAVTATWPAVHRASVRAVGGDLPYLPALHVSMSAFTVSHAVPGGGAVGAGVAVERLTAFGLPGPLATASATLTGPVSLTTILGLGTAGVTVAVAAGDLPRVALLLALGGLSALMLLVAIIVAATRSPRAGERVIERLARLHPRLARHAPQWRSSWHTVAEHGPTGGDVARIFGWSAVKWTADVGSLALVFVAFGQSPRPTVLLVGFAVSQALAAVPVSPGGLGVVEGGLVGAFVALGVAAPVATTVALTYRVLEAWLPMLAGIPVLLRPPAPRPSAGDQAPDP